jgi:hypothetical protein
LSERIAVAPPVARLDAAERPAWVRLHHAFRPPADETPAGDPGHRPPGGAPALVAVEAWLSPVDDHGALHAALPLAPVADGGSGPWRLAPPFHDGLAEALASLAAGEEPAIAPEALARLAAASGFAGAREPGFFDRLWLSPACLAFGYQHAGETLAALAAGRLDGGVASARTLTLVPVAGADDEAVARDARVLLSLVAGRLAGPRPVLAKGWRP